jgi:hypothetical protein
VRNYLVFALWLMLCYSAEAKRKPSASSVTLLTPSYEKLVRQNLCANQMELQRIQDEVELQSLVTSGTLAAIADGDAVQIAPGLPENRRYALPFTVNFLLTLAEAYRERFGRRLTVDSAVRPRSVQVRLRRVNRSAAPADGEAASSHETGATIDLSKNLSGAQLRWLRNMLSYEAAMSHAIVEEEKHCFHIMVLKEVE